MLMTGFDSSRSAEGRLRLCDKNEHSSCIISDVLLTQQVRVVVGDRFAGLAAGALLPTHNTYIYICFNFAASTPSSLFLPQCSKG